jgi:FkbM family methyltransferase
MNSARKLIRLLSLTRDPRIALQAWRRGIPWLHLERLGKSIVIKGTKIPVEELPLPFPEGLSLYLGLLAPFGFGLQVVDQHGEKTLLLDTGEVRLWLDEADVTGMAEEVFGVQEYGFLISKESIVIDIGMNVATTALYFAKESAVKRVIAFEPSSAALERAAENFAINADLAKKIEVRPYALGDGFGQAFLQIVPTHSGLSRIGRTHSPEVTSSARVLVEIRDAEIELRSVVAKAGQHQQIILKVDCEGSEREVFRSLSANTLSRIDVILLEWHHPEIFAEIREKLEKLAFRLLVRRMEKSRGFLYAFREEMMCKTATAPVLPSISPVGQC